MDVIKQKDLSFQEVGQKRRIVAEIEFTPLTIQTEKLVPLKRVKKRRYSSMTLRYSEANKCWGFVR